MPRRKLIYTDYYPYHIMARSNNKEWFYIPQKQVWDIFTKLLNDLSQQESLKVHAFVLMNNHYHLIATTPHANLGQVMQHLQMRASHIINKTAGRINHVFGGPYKGSLITTPTHYKTVLKYVYRNPVTAGICNRVEHYPFSTINPTKVQTSLPYNIDALLTYKKEVLLPWLNQTDSDSLRLGISKGLQKTEFKPVTPRSY